MGEEIEGEEQSQDSSTRASLDFVYGEAKDALRGQWAAIEAIDTKAGVLFGAIAILISVLLSSLTEQRLSSVPAVLGILAIILMASASVFTFFALDVKSYKVDPNPGPLAKKYLHQPESDTKLQVLANLVDNLNTNSTILQQKADSLKLAWRLAIVGILLLTAASLFTIVDGSNFKLLLNKIAEIWELFRK